MVLKQCSFSILTLLRLFKVKKMWENAYDFKAVMSFSRPSSRRRIGNPTLTDDVLRRKGTTAHTSIGRSQNVIGWKYNAKPQNLKTTPFGGKLPRSIFWWYHLSWH
jgi:hypothetical protein